MTDIDILKQALIAIKCDFSSCTTFIGFTVTINTGIKTIDFEFDEDGDFMRII